MRSSVIKNPSSITIDSYPKHGWTHVVTHINNQKVDGYRTIHVRWWNGRVLEFGYSSKKYSYVVKYTQYHKKYEITVKGTVYLIDALTYLLDKNRSTLYSKNQKVQTPTNVSITTSDFKLEIGKTYSNEIGDIKAKILSYETNLEFVNEPVYIALIDSLSRLVFFYRENGECVSSSSKFNLVPNIKMIEVYTYTWFDTSGTARSAVVEVERDRMPVGLEALLKINPNHSYNKTVSRLPKVTC